MPNIQLTCPYCKATLNFAQQLPAGTPIPCLICNRSFPAPSAASVPAAAAPVASPWASAVAAPKTRSPAPTAPVTVKNGSLLGRPATRGAAGAAPGATLPAAGASAAGRALGVLALVAVALVMLAGLAYVVWQSALASRMGDDTKPAPASLAKGPDLASRDGAKGSAEPVAPKDPPEKDSKPPRKVEPPPAGGVDIADLPKKADPPRPPPPIIDLTPKTPEPEPKRPPPPVVPVVIPAPPIAPGVDAARIDAAIARGVRYLKEHQLPTGSWSAGPHSIGYAALGGLALLECDFPPTDPAVKKVAALVREQAGTLSDTYQGSLAVLFLDRLGDPRDRPTIRALSLWVLAGQMDSGAWPYNFQPLNLAVTNQLDGYLKTHWPWSPRQPRPANAPAKGGAAPGPGKEDKSKLLPPLPRGIDLQNLPADELNWARPFQRQPPLGFGDTSNTQFALLALWTARRYDIAVEAPILLSFQRFRKTQNDDGGWGYNQREPHLSEAMTCAGLLGAAMGPGIAPPPGGKGAFEDPTIQKGLTALSGHIGEASPDAAARPKMRSLYFLWSLERIGVLFDLKTIGGKDWYGWGRRCCSQTRPTTATGWALPIRRILRSSTLALRCCS